MDESVNDFARVIGCNLFAAETEHVRIIMLAGQRGGFFVTNERRTNAWDFVGHNAHADAGGANKNSKIVLMLGHRVRDAQRMVRIIAGFPGMAAKVADRMAL